MPISMSVRVRRLSQSEFGELAYQVMRCVFEIHDELGRLFDEQVYKRELAYRSPGVQREVPITAWHGSFAKSYYLDVLVADGGLFEFKMAETLVSKHRAQTLNYLYLADLGHGKLVNLRPEQVEHEFVNTTWTREDRLRFELVMDRWRDEVPGARRFREVLTALLHDWGAGLELPLYQEALTHFLGGAAQVLAEVEVRLGNHTLGHQKMSLAAPRTAFFLTALGRSAGSFETDAQRLLRHAELDAILWADLRLTTVTLITLG